MKGFADFELDLREVLLEKLVVKFGEMDPGVLSDVPEGEIPDAQGVYQLFLEDELVYVGKTDADAGLRTRLKRHSRKVLHRQNLNPVNVHFKALRIFVFTPMDIESELIKRCRESGTSSWNGSGFGSNDPGRERDTSKPGEFDAQYPIDLDRPIRFQGVEDKFSAAAALANLRSAVPYLLRTEAQGRKPHPDLVAASVGVPEGNITARSLISRIVSKLPTGWQATALPGYVILYKKHEDYAYGQVIARS
jgi:hypothetical protein